MNESWRAVELLLVEDSRADVMMMREVLADTDLRNHLSTVEDGVEAMAFLRREGKYAQVPRPDLILLDLNMPRKDGREVLTEIKMDDSLKRIPVVILTTSKDEKDIGRAYDLHANCYITKPVDFPSFIEAVKVIKNFWFSVVTLPPE